MASNSPPLPALRAAAQFFPPAWTLLFLCCAALVAFVRLDIPLQEPQESRYAEIPRQMLAEGRWLVPVLHGKPYLDKPPLLYWLVMGSYSLFGVHDWAARIVPSTAAFLTMIVTYLWARRLLGVRGGFLAGTILCLSGRYVYLSRMLTMDTLLCLFVVAALAGAHLAMRGPIFGWRFWLASALACGLGLLTKGPVALVLVVLPVFGLRFIARDAFRPRLAAWLAYSSVAVGVALPWHVAVVAADLDFIDYFILKQNVERFVTPFDHQEPFWFYAPGILVGMMPWTLLLLGMVWPFVKGCLNSSLAARFLPWKPGFSAQKPGFQGKNRVSQAFFLLAFAWCVLFFSLAGCKRPGYVLPAMPLLALALACYLDARLPAGDAVASILRHRSRLAFAGTLLVAVEGVGGGFLAMHLRLVSPVVGAAMLTVGLAAMLLLGLMGRRHGVGVSWLICGAATFALLITGVLEILPGYARKFSMRGQVRPHAAECADASLAVACYPRRWDSVSFYLGRDDVRAYTADERRRLVADLAAAPRTLLFVKSNQALQELLGELPAALEFDPEGQQGTILVGFVRPRAGASTGPYAQR